MRRSLTILAEVIVLVGLYLAVGAAMTLADGRRSCP